MIIWDLVCYYKNTRVLYSIVFCVTVVPCYSTFLSLNQATFVDLTIAAWNGF